MILKNAEKVASSPWEVEEFDRFTRKPFFRITKRIITEYYGIVNDSYPSYFMWTNLMKIVPKKSGNPTDRDFYIQTPICKKIFKYELDVAKPKNVVLFAGAITDNNNWAYDFIENLGIDPKDKKSTADIVAIYDYKGTRIIHVVRPEIKRKGHTEDGIYKKIISNMK